MSKSYRNRRNIEHKKSAKVTVQSLGVGCLILVSLVMAGCRTTSSPQKRYTTWKVFKLRKDLRGDYDKAWAAIAEAVHRRYGIESHDKHTGHIRSRWIDGRPVHHSSAGRTRLEVLLHSSAVTFCLRAEPQQQDSYDDVIGDSSWYPDTDGILRSKTYYDLVNEVGRTVLNEY